ncbi:hypothetical protein PTSG_04826 [Salpingoeca rosetta]|uniref:DHHA2 domain-containing protein n=1 Tax=Salpingoeca rosetta (strain ATCC 50818 / BSB-021) TaxID=946362 RepID=F2U9T5_SALR5|nr:uncharacterized protein PTSG_04826 [Salpingoeca rosetta]EGD73112.1 hypothetical protein PTSG_04826 [Salpingoeca rosetta]|eukprot:XP_004994143.1 hypothetical protein PTSG_04826 [Salpingoeca rosetta]
MSSLPVFVRKARAWLAAASPATKLSVVLGNESADLDSVASALCLAFVRTRRQQTDEGSPIIPIVNVSRADLPLRTEVTFVLEKLGIDAGDLVCRDEVDLAGFAAAQSLDVTLVDHNRLAGHQTFLQPFVTHIVDHHVDEHDFDPSVSTIEMIGSCSSLVARQYTVNLDRSKGRTFDTDEAAAALMKPFCDVDADKWFSAIQEAKFNCAHLTTMQLLRKDYKEIGARKATVGFPAVTMDLQQLVQKERFLEDLEEFRCSHHLDLVVIMSTVFAPEFARQLALYTHASLRATAWWPAIVEALEGNGELQLERLALESPDSLIAYQQHNIKKSRKAVLPFVRSVVEGLAAPPPTGNDRAST